MLSLYSFFNKNIIHSQKLYHPFPPTANLTQKINHPIKHQTEINPLKITHSKRHSFTTFFIPDPPLYTIIIYTASALGRFRLFVIYRAHHFSYYTSASTPPHTFSQYISIHSVVTHPDRPTEYLSATIPPEAHCGKVPFLPVHCDRCPPRFVRIYCYLYWPSVLGENWRLLSGEGEFRCCRLAKTFWGSRPLIGVEKFWFRGI